MWKIRYVIDQRSVNDWIFGRSKLIAICSWKGFSKFWNAGREDCYISKQHHSEFPIKKIMSDTRKRKPRQRTCSWDVDTSFSWSMTPLIRAHDTALHYVDFFSVTLRGDNFQDFDKIWDEVLLSMTKNPWESGDSSEDSGSQLWVVGNHDKEYRIGTSFTKRWR